MIELNNMAFVIGLSIRPSAEDLKIVTQTDIHTYIQVCTALTLNIGQIHNTTLCFKKNIKTNWRGTASQAYTVGPMSPYGKSSNTATTWLLWVSTNLILPSSKKRFVFASIHLLSPQHNFSLSILNNKLLDCFQLIAWVRVEYFSVNVLVQHPVACNAFGRLGH